VLTTRTYHDTYEHDWFHVSGGSAVRVVPGVSGLPCYRTSLVCVPDIIGALTVCRQNTKQNKNHGICNSLVPLIEGLCAQILYFRFEIISGLRSHLLLFLS